MNEAKTKVLIVDDDLRLRDLLTRYLSEHGFATEAVDRAGVGKLLEREQGDVLVLDLMLPGDDCWSSIRGNRSRAKSRDGSVAA
jgi:two-component system phosphate regulon response regulator OmpR